MSLTDNLSVPSLSKYCKLKDLKHFLKISDKKSIDM